MKALLLKITILSFCLFGLISPNAKAITVTAYGNYYISDIYHPTDTYTIYAYIEVNSNYYPCSSNPFATGIGNGTPVASPTLTFYNVYFPIPPISIPYRVVLRAVRQSDGVNSYG
jgi:hypothetical protein